MELFPELKALHLQTNGINAIEGLENNTMLRCLYLHENCISKMEGLSTLKKLVNLQLSDNLIKTIEGIEECESLDSLYIARNFIGKNGLSDLRCLLDRPTITCLDLQNNTRVSVD